MVHVWHASFHTGQNLFFPLHHLLLSYGAVYVVLINLKELLFPVGKLIREEWTGEEVRPHFQFFFGFVFFWKKVTLIMTLD